MSPVSSPDFSSEPLAALVRTRPAPKKRLRLNQALLSQIVLIAVFISALLILDGFTRNYATLVLQFGPERRTFEGEVIAGMTVLDALNASAVAGNIPLEFLIDESNKTQIVTLGSRQHIPSERITFIINGQTVSSLDIHALPVNTHDRIEVTIR